MSERAGLLANEITASKDLRYEQAQKLIKFDEIIVRGDALLFNSLFLKVHATVILFLFSFFLSFSDPPLYVGFFTLYSFLLNHLDRTLVYHLNLYLSIYLVKHLLWLSVNGGGWDYTVQGSSPHKCGQKSCWSAFNAVVTAFPLNISIFLSSPYVLEVHPHRWRLLEDHLNYPGTCLTNIRSIREE